jgi:abequosyltransferase
MPELPLSAAPLLTLAVPTFNRAEDLKRFLTTLEPQMQGRSDVDFYLSDNASEDSTAELVARFQAKGMPIRYHRHEENVGADANFVSCFNAARGKYFWLCGDDEVVLPGGLDLIVSQLQTSASDGELDILYLTCYNFVTDYIAEQQPDRLQREYQTFTSARRLTFLLNVNFTFISGVVVNRERFLQLPHEDPSAFLGTNLVQLSWTLPLRDGETVAGIRWPGCSGRTCPRSPGVCCLIAPISPIAS